jgi:hypothetical protein
MPDVDAAGVDVDFELDSGAALEDVVGVAAAAVEDVAGGAEVEELDEPEELVLPHPAAPIASRSTASAVNRRTVRLVSLSNVVNLIVPPLCTCRSPGMARLGGLVSAVS